MLIFSSFIFFSSLIIFKGYKFVACPHISKNNTYLNMISMAHFVRLFFYRQTLIRRLIYGGPLSTMGRSVPSFQTDVDLGGARGSKIQSVLQMLLMDHSWLFLSFNLRKYPQQDPEPCRNQPIDLLCKSIDWFPHNTILCQKYLQADLN